MSKDWNERNNLNHINVYTFYFIGKTTPLVEVYKGVFWLRLHSANVEQEQGYFQPHAMGN